MKVGEKIVKMGLGGTALISVAVLFIVVGYVFINGVGVINHDFLLESPYRFEYGGIFPQKIGTLCLVGVCLLFAVPLGVASAIYLAEYAPDNVVTKSVRFFVECLAGIPSIVIGLFGLIFLVYYLGFGISMLSGGLSLGFMILPWTVRASEEAIKVVPRSYREASLALGASKWQTIRSVVLKSAYPGIITGILLGMGKAIGETAVILLTRFRSGILFAKVNTRPCWFVTCVYLHDGNARTHFRCLFAYLWRFSRANRSIFDDKRIRFGPSE